MGESQRIAIIKNRLTALNRLLPKYEQRTQEQINKMTLEEVQFWTSRYEEREQLQAELDQLLRRKVG
jgi:hypothetical protein